MSSGSSEALVDAFLRALPEFLFCSTEAKLSLFSVPLTQWLRVLGEPTDGFLNFTQQLLGFESGQDYSISPVGDHGEGVAITIGALPAAVFARNSTAFWDGLDEKRRERIHRFCQLVELQRRSSQHLNVLPTNSPISTHRPPPHTEIHVTPGVSPDSNARGCPLTHLSSSSSASSRLSPPIPSQHASLASESSPHMTQKSDHSKGMAGSVGPQSTEKAAGAHHEAGGASDKASDKADIRTADSSTAAAGGSKAGGTRRKSSRLHARRAAEIVSRVLRV